MPSSLIFLGLVLLWLLILVPTVARRRQEVARPSMAALSGRVLRRPRQRRQVRRRTVGRPTGRTELRTEEVDEVPEIEESVAEEPAAVLHVDDEPVDELGAPAGWEPPVPRYRPGRGGFDPAAAALAARARYAFRQRVALALLVTAALTGLGAGLVLRVLWWPHAAVDVVLVGYLVYLRRHVRLEEAIRERRAARMAGTRRSAAAEDGDLDDWARRGRAAASAASAGRSGEDEPVADEPAPDDAPAGGARPATADRPAPVVVADPADDAEPEPALPRLTPAALPALPSGTALLDADDLDPDLPAVDLSARRDYRRAVGQ